MRSVRFPTALGALVAAASAAATAGQVGWNELLSSYPSDVSLNAAKGKVQELNAPTSPQLWENMELRYDAKRSDLRKQEFDFRIEPAGYGELAANRSLTRSRRVLGDAVLRDKIGDALCDRYKLALDWIYQTRQRSYHQAIVELEGRRLEAFSRSTSDPHFQAEDLVQAQVKRTEFVAKAESDVYSLAEIENHIRQFLPGSGDIRLEGDLLAPKEIETILSRIDPQRVDSFPNLAIAAGNLELAKSRAEKEIAASRRWVSYLEAGYTSDVDENRLERQTLRDDISFGFGVRIPLFDGGSQEIARRKADLAEARLIFQDDKEDVQRKVEALRISIGSRLRQMVVLDSFTTRVNAGGLFASFAIKASGSPLLLLSAQEISIEEAWRSEDLRFQILYDYLDILHLTGALSDHPGVNHLLARAPVVSVASPSSAPPQP